MVQSLRQSGSLTTTKWGNFIARAGQLPESRAVYKVKVNEGAVQKKYIYIVLPHASICLFGARTNGGIGLQIELYKGGL